MRDPDPVVIPFEEALRLVDEGCAGRSVGSERVATRAALGRVLAADQSSRLALPPFDKSAVDGYALPEAQPAGSLSVVGVVHAGEPPPGPLAPGTAVKVMTGAPVPSGTARVVMVEHTEVSGERVRVVREERGRNFCARGEDLRPGDPVLPAGTTLRPLDLANLIAAGVTEVEVARRVRLALLATGDELVDDPAEIVAGRIMNSNGPMLAALATRPALEVVREQRVPDDPASTRQAIASAAEEADVVVLSGGVSEGDSDYVAPAFSALGARILFTRVAVKPGKPLTFAVGAHALLLGLPGNPVSAFVMFQLVALRIAARLAVARGAGRALRLPLAAPFHRRRADRLELVPARLNDVAALEPLRSHGSAHLHALTAADGLFQVAVGVSELAAGETVPFHPLGGWPGP